ncbi:MAG: hypothetical protein JW967_01440 [Dehalococcoidales bacterium]|nr:hypothetical protein [Dehalococcoidales bacterium]
MLVTFPHIGNAYIGVKAMCHNIGADVIIPPKTTSLTMSLATKYSPEGVCIPFKLNLGNMIQALEMGADTILNVTGHGTCRMGYYFKVQELILRDMGFNFKMLLTGLSENKFQSFLSMLKRVSHNASWLQIFRAFQFGVAKMTALDDIEIMTNKIRAMEKKKGTATGIYRQAINAIDNAADYSGLRRVVDTYEEKLGSIARNDKPPLKILVVGEIYVVLDPYANMDVELELGKLGAMTTRSLYLSRWVKSSIVWGMLKRDQWHEVHRAARPYLKRDVGGDGWETVGEKAISVGKYDGIVHLAPFTCMPEGTAQNIMPSMKEKTPVLAIYCDEQTSKAGVITRLEAFTDMLRIHGAKSNGHIVTNL